MKALLSAHALHPQFDARSGKDAFRPEALHDVNGMLPPRVRKPLRRLVEHLKQRIGTGRRTGTPDPQ